MARSDPDPDSTFDHDVHFSSGNNEWATPTPLMRQLAAAVDGIDLDPCSGAEDHAFAEHTFTAEDDGLAQPWHGTCYVNPPYDSMPAWMEKVSDEVAAADGPELVVVMIPARTSTDWFHNYVTEADLIGLFDERLNFNDADNGAPFPSALVVYDGTSGDESGIPSDLEELMAHRGQVYEPKTILEDGEQAAFDELFDVDAPERATASEQSHAAVADGRAIATEALVAAQQGDALALTLADRTMGYPDGVDAEPTVTVVDERLTSEGEVREVLVVADHGPAGSTAEETYYLLSHPIEAPERAACTVCADGTSGWTDVTLQAVEPADSPGGARRVVAASV